MDWEADIANEILAGTGWEALDDVTIECPEGHQMEWDGECHCGPSMLRQLGMI